MNAILDMPSDAYHADDIGATPTLSATIARVLCSQTPAHAWAQHPKLNPAFVRQDDQKFDVGNAVHALLLEGEDKAHVVHADSWRTKEAKEARDEARANGRVPLLATQYEEAHAMLAAVRQQLANLDVDPLPFTHGKPEQTITWEENGVACRARIDWLHDNGSAVDDLKTTSRSADPSAWARTLFAGHGDVQAAMYVRGVRAVTGSTPEFRYVICETAAPYGVSVVSLAPDAFALANEKLDYALRVWARCLELDRWECWPARICFAEAPGWAESQWLEREAMEEAATT